MSTQTAVQDDGGSAMDRAEWTTAYINDLPDSSFLYIAAGGSKDGEGKTTPRSLRFFPVKDANGKVDLPHLRNALARIPQSSAPAAAKQAAIAKAQRMLKAAGGTPGRSDEFRAAPLEYELRDDGDTMPTLVGHLAVFNDWTEINSRLEGHFMEQIAPGAFTKTIKENLPRMRCLFQHGKDPAVGEKPLGPIRLLAPDDKGLAYEVPLLDTTYNRDIVEMLRAEPAVLGSSFRFTATRDQFESKPGKSTYNPRGIPERTVQEVRLSEFGPVTFPAYPSAGAGLRSITDRMFGLDDEERVDVEDMGCLAQMINLGACYIDEQDDPGDEVNIPKMEGVLQTLSELMQYEAQESEPPDEPEDEDEMSSAARRSTEGAAPPTRTSTNSAGYLTHPGRGRREPSLYLKKGRERRSWELP